MRTDFETSRRRGEPRRRMINALVAGALLSGAVLFPAAATAAPDPDQDGLLTEDEVSIGTDPFRYDTDMDGLSDFQEVRVTSTDPMKADTDGDGVSDGTERDNKTDPRVSDKPAANPAKPPPFDESPPGTQPMFVNGDVDVYDAPGGDGNVIGMLDFDEEGKFRRSVNMYSCRPDNWCEIIYTPGPNGRGWVWGDFLDRMA
jgi:Bacterial TSP3 repeat